MKQIDDFDAHVSSMSSLGFTVLKGVASHLMPELERLWSASGIKANAGSPERRITRFGYLRDNPITQQLFQESVLGELLAQLNATALVQDEFNVLIGDSFWHRDGAIVPKRAYRVTLYLDAVDIGRGALSVVPASHLRQDLWGEEEIVRLTKLERKCKAGQCTVSAYSVFLPTQPGDIIVFHCGLIHGSFGGHKRRQAAFVFVGKPESESDRYARTAFVLNRMLFGSMLFE